MESQPHNTEFRNNLENFHPGISWKRVTIRLSEMTDVINVLKLEEICSIIDAHMRLNECIITKAI